MLDTKVQVRQRLPPRDLRVRGDRGQVPLLCSLRRCETGVAGRVLRRAGRLQTLSSCPLYPRRPAVGGFAGRDLGIRLWGQAPPQAGWAPCAAYFRGEDPVSPGPSSPLPASLGHSRHGAWPSGEPASPGEGCTAQRGTRKGQGLQAWPWPCCACQSPPCLMGTFMRDSSWAG